MHAIRAPLEPKAPHFASKLQAVLNAAAHLTKFSHVSSLIRNSLYWLPICQTRICSLVRNCLTCSALQYLKAYSIPVSSIPGSHFTLRSSARATWLSLRHESLWLNIEVLLLWAYPTQPSYLSPLEIFLQYHLISSASTWKPSYLSLKTLTRVGRAI